MWRGTALPMPEVGALAFLHGERQSSVGMTVHHCGTLHTCQSSQKKPAPASYDIGLFLGHLLVL